MDEHNGLAEAFEEKRAHLRTVAYRMLGSLNEADDAVQEAWLRLSRADVSGVGNLGGWLTTVVARVCLDMLRARKARREEPLETGAPEPVARQPKPRNPEQEVLLADSIGLALLVVLHTLAPAERIAFVLHDMFDLSFDEIAPIVGRSPIAARQLASRARRRVRGNATVPEAELAQQREVVETFVAALRRGDFDALVAVLDPDVAVRAETVAGGARSEIRGAATWARSAIAYARQMESVQVALVNGAAGIVLAPGGRLARALIFSFAAGKISHVEVIADPARLRQLDIAVLGG
jgi:RNA polymerase sigma factor (sigma-70 family)